MSERFGVQCMEQASVVWGFDTFHGASRHHCSDFAGGDIEGLIHVCGVGDVCEA